LKVRYLLMDVDGVLTDGRIIYTERGDEIKEFHVRDGSGLALWRRAGLESGVLTGRRSDLVLRRGLELGMGDILQGVSDKAAAFEELVKRRGLTAEQVCFVGDDWVDVAVLRRCGLAAAPADAAVDAQAQAHYVTQANGGRGAVREVIELVLRTQGKWETLVREAV
jgi:3-deoxy-D-manno-octulosonate 8-phosphate phosphatase (KDO 8-P phosphatase)